MGHALTANAIRDAAESKAALAAKCRNLRRGSFMAMLSELEHLSLSYPEAALMSAYGTILTIQRQRRYPDLSRF